MNSSQLSPRVGHYRWRIIALLFFATTINYIDRQVLGMLKPIITDDIHISEADYGYIVSAFQAAYAVGLLFIGRIIDKFGTRMESGRLLPCCGARRIGFRHRPLLPRVGRERQFPRSHQGYG